MKTSTVLFVFLLLFTLSSNIEAQNRILKGQVVSDRGTEALIGVTVIEKGTINGTVTDLYGNFTLTVSENAVINVSYVGFIPQSIAVKGQKDIRVVLIEDLKNLNEVVVVGYGSSKKKDLTGSVGIIDGDNLKVQATQNVSQAMQGRVAGVQITNDGRPGGSPLIRIRGMASVAGEAAPLYIVDNVIVKDISFLGPNDIENISILKDASSSAIYGVRASNGVILITTKKGSNSAKPKVSLDAYFGTNRPSNSIEMANGPEYIKLFNEKMLYTNQTKRLDPADFSSYDYLGSIVRPSRTNMQNLSITGGSETVRYNFGLNHLKNDGLVEFDNFDRIGFRSKVDIDINKRIKMGFSTILTSSKSNPQNTFWGIVRGYQALPIAGPKDENGDWTDLNSISSTTNVTAGMFYNKNNYQTKIDAVLNGYLEVNIMKDLTFNTNLSFSPRQTDFFNYTPSYWVASNFNNPDNTMRRTVEKYSMMLWDNTLTYTKTIAKKHNIKLMAGHSYQNEFTSFFGVTAKGFKDLPEIDHSYFFMSMPTIQGKQNSSFPDDTGNRIVAESYFGRASYDYEHKYLLTATLRNDISTKFPESNRSGYFPSVGLGWVLSEESFMKDKGVDFLKLRASWGLKGNANIPSNIYNEVVNFDNNYGAVIFGPGQNTGYGTVSGSAIINQLANPNLTWEKISEINLGADLVLMSNRLSANLDLYNRQVKDAIFPITGLTQSGLNADGTWGNNASISNKGIELALGWTDRAKDFTYSLNGNISFNKNKVTELSSMSAGGIYGKIWDFPPTFTFSTLNHPLAEFYGLQMIGVFQNEEEIKNKPAKPGSKPGDFIYADLNGDNTIDERDRTFLGNPNPTFTYGFNANIGYKDFDLNIFVQGVGGNKIANKLKMYRYDTENFEKDFVINRWHGEGTSNTQPSAAMSDALVFSSYYVENGSYFRINNLQLGYTLPKSLTAKFGVDRLRVYISGDNLHTFTKYTGFTPEVASSGVLTGVDGGTYPNPSSYTFGLNLNF